MRYIYGKIAKIAQRGKKTENSTIKPLFTISVPCLKIEVPCMKMYYICTMKIPVPRCRRPCLCMLCPVEKKKIHKILKNRVGKNRLCNTSLL